MKAPTSLTEITVEFISKYKNELNLTVHEIPSFTGMTTSEKDPEFIKYFKSEISKIQDGELKYYLIKTKEIPHLFFANSKNLIHVNVSPVFMKSLTFVVYDSEIKNIFRYNTELDKETMIHTVFSNKPKFNYYYSALNFKKEVSPRVIFEPEGYVINVIKGSYDKLYVVNNQSMNVIEEIEYKKDFIIAKFSNSFYNKIVFDYNFKILEIDFHHTIKKKLNILNSIKDIVDYTDMVRKLKDNFDWFRLLNDSNYKLKNKEEDFKKHINLVTSVTKNKQYLLEQANKMINFNESYNFNLDIVSLFKPHFIKNNLLSFEFAKKTFGFNPLANIDYTGFDDNKKYALGIEASNEISCKLLATLLLLKENKHNPMPEELIEHVKKTSKENDALINTYIQEFNK